MASNLGNILALNYSDETNYAAALPEFKGRLIVLSHEELIHTDHLLYAEHIPDLESSPAGWERALQLHRELGYDQVITDNEYEIERAARLREVLQLEGQRPPSAILFRDKIQMKHAASKVVCVPNSIALTSHEDLGKVALQLGYPFVIKPVDQGGSREVKIVWSAEDLAVERGTSWPYRMEAEEFIDGELFHVDAYVGPDTFFASSARYSVPPIDFAAGRPLAHILIEPESPTAAELAAFLKALLPALNAPSRAVYHLEVFRRRSDNSLVLCEIACRAGGAQIPELVKLSYGIDLSVEALRAGAGLPLSREPAYSGRVYASLIFPSLGGLFLAAPAEIPIAGVHEVRFRRKVGQAHPPSAHSNDHVMCVILQARDYEELRELASQVEEYVLETWQWS